MAIDGEAIYRKLKKGCTAYKEEIHCPLLLNVMGDANRGTVSAFCVEAFISDDLFYKWLDTHELFCETYGLAKMFSREIWEEEGRELKYHVTQPGTQDCRFEHWRLIGWSRFGVGKNSRIRVNLDPKDSPIEHYKQLIKQAGKGDFTAGEIKQLIEAINVGLRAHETFTMQKEIDQLKADHELMLKNSNVKNSSRD